jgi:DNA-binding NtrC family response regulator
MGEASKERKDLAEGASVEAFVGSSRGVLKVLEQAAQAASTKYPVLIFGETGTGKELIARKIHNGNGPFVPVDCTHLTQELAERELFGHVRGAYTGAHADGRGLIEAADGGVAFFDEIGELPLELQSKLLRVLEGRKFRPLGSTVERCSDFRVLAATNRDLRCEAVAGRFRWDLYYRLNVIKIAIPPLRERHEDIPLLLSYFEHREKVVFSVEARAILESYTWPGNVRELENLVKRTAAMCRGSAASVADLPGTIHASVTMSMIKGTPEQCQVPNIRRPAIQPLKQIERLAIIEALKESAGDVTTTAYRLNMARATLYRRLRSMENDQRYALLLQQIRGSKASSISHEPKSSNSPTR